MWVAGFRMGMTMGNRRKQESKPLSQPQSASRLTGRVNPVALPTHNYLCIRVTPTNAPSRRIPHTPTEVIGVPFRGFARRVLPLNGLGGDPP